MTNDTGRQIARAAEEAGALSERQQDAFNVFKAMISGVPVIGSPIATLISDYIPSLKEQRLKWFIEDLTNDVEKMKQQIDANKVMTEEYADTFEKCMRGIIDNLAPEKRAAFRAILLNSLKPTDVSFDERDYFISKVYYLSHVHLRILSILHNARAFHSADKPHVRRHPASHLEYLAFSAGVDPGIIESVVHDLDMQGFFRLGGIGNFIHTGMDDQRVHDDLRILLSDHALRFITFCTANPDG